MKHLQWTNSSLINYNNRDLHLYKEEQSVISELADCIQNQESFLICTPNIKIFYTLILEALCKDELINFKYKQKPERRAKILIVTNRREMMDFFVNCTINTHTLFQSCRELHQHLGYCDMNDPYFAKVYWRHILYQYYNGNIPDQVPLHFVYPVATGYHTFHTVSRGNRNVLGRKDNQESTFYITDNVNILKNQSSEFDYIFVDCSRIKKIIPIHLGKTLYFFGNPLDDRIAYLQKYKLKNYIMSGGMLSSINSKETDKYIVSLQEMVRKSSVNSLDIEYVPSEFDDAVELILRLLDNLKKENFSKYDINTVSKLIYLIIRIPVSATLYDLIAEMQPYHETIRGLMEEITNSEHRYENDMFEEILRLLEDILYKYKLDSISPKWEELKGFILREYSQGKKVCIISSNKVSQLALKEVVSISLGITAQELGSHGIQFVLIKDIMNEVEDIRCDSLIIYSAINFRDLSSLLKVSYKKAKVYMYSIEINLIINKLNKLLHIRNYAVSHFEKEQHLAMEESIYRYLFNRLNKFVRQKTIKLDETLAKLTEDNTQTRKYILRETKDYKGKDAISARLIQFSDSSIAFFTKNSRIQVLDRKNKRVIVKKFHEVGLNDNILFIDNDTRKDLYKVFINSIDGKDVNKRLYMLIERWRELYEEKYIELRMGDEKLYRKMKDLGWDKTTKSILKNWRTGYSYGPRDKEDIIVLGNALGIKEFLDDVNLYHDAMSKIRAEKRSVSKILNKIIYYSNKKMDHEDIAVIEKYNLSVEQLRESLIIKTVKEVHKKKAYKVKPMEIGILFEVNDKE